MQARYRQRREEVIFRSYMANATKNINDAVAESLGGKVMQYKYDEIVTMKEDDTETRTAEEIIQHIKDGLDRIGA